MVLGAAARGQKSSLVLQRRPSSGLFKQGDTDPAPQAPPPPREGGGSVGGSDWQFANHLNHPFTVLELFTLVLVLVCRVGLKPVFSTWSCA